MTCGHTPLFMDSFRGPEQLLPCLFCERDRLRESLAEMEARAIAAVWLIPGETLFGELQDLKRKATLLLAIREIPKPTRSSYSPDASGEAAYWRDLDTWNAAHA